MHECLKLPTCLAGPTLWSRDTLAKYFLQRFGAAASAFAASLLLLLPASAEPTVVRWVCTSPGLGLQQSDAQYLQSGA